MLRALAGRTDDESWLTRILFLSLLAATIAIASRTALFPAATRWQHASPACPASRRDGAPRRSKWGVTRKRFTATAPRKHGGSSALFCSALDRLRRVDL